MNLIKVIVFSLLVAIAATIITPPICSIIFHLFHDLPPWDIFKMEDFIWCASSFNLLSAFMAVFGVSAILYAASSDKKIERNERRKQFFKLYSDFFDSYSALLLTSVANNGTQSDIHGNDVIKKLNTIVNNNEFLRKANEAGLYLASQKLFRIFNWLYIENLYLCNKLYQDRSKVYHLHPEIKNYRTLLLEWMQDCPEVRIVFGRYRAQTYELDFNQQSGPTRGLFFANVIIPYINIERYRRTIEIRAEDHLDPIDESHSHFNMFKNGKIDFKIMDFSDERHEITLQVFISNSGKNSSHSERPELRLVLDTQSYQCTSCINIERRKMPLVRL